MTAKSVSRVIPICFAFDKRFELAAKVAITSLLESSDFGTFYKIYLLVQDFDCCDFGLFAKKYNNCDIHVINVPEQKDWGAYEVRGITKATYSRLLLPKLVAESKVLYSDVDMVFRKDVSSALDLLLDDNLVAGVVDFDMNASDHSYMEDTLGLSGKSLYIQAGFLVLNLERMRKENVIDSFQHLSWTDYKYQDQDIINIACEGRIDYLPLCYNATTQMFQKSKYNVIGQFYSNTQYKDALKSGTLHYNGQKPWYFFCKNMLIWWRNFIKNPYSSVPMVLQIFGNYARHFIDRLIKVRA